MIPDTADRYEKYERLMRLRSSLIYPGVVISGGVAFALESLSGRMEPGSSPKP